MILGKKDLVAHLAQAVDMTQEKAGKTLDEILSWIRSSLKSGNDVRLIGLGTFSVQKRAERDGRNPQTGETIKVPASNRATFKGSKELKDALNQE